MVWLLLAASLCLSLCSHRRRAPGHLIVLRPLDSLIQCGEPLVLVLFGIKDHLYGLSACSTVQRPLAHSLTHHALVLFWEGRSSLLTRVGFHGDSHIRLRLVPDTLAYGGLMEAEGGVVLPGAAGMGSITVLGQLGGLTTVRIEAKSPLARLHKSMPPLPIETNGLDLQMAFQCLGRGTGWRETLGTRRPLI